MKNPSTLVGGVRWISLTRGKRTCIDEADWAKVQKYHWGTLKSGRTFYAVAALPRALGTRKQLCLLLHSLLLPDALTVDHKDGDGLRNQRENLRPATQAEQCRNRRKRLGCSSAFKGVCWDVQSRKWFASIFHLRKSRFLGRFLDETAAARAYDAAAIKFFGEFAKLNFPRP